MHTKILIRTDSFIEHYQHWLQKDVKDVMEMLSGSYANEVFGKGADDLKYDTTKDFKRINWHPPFIPHQVFGFLMDLFKTKLIAFAGYQISLSDERTEVFDNGLRFTTHRYFLKESDKPSKNLKNYHNLQFGSLLLEHRFNKTSNEFRLTATNNKEEPQTSFEKLMEFLLS